LLLALIQRGHFQDAKSGSIQNANQQPGSNEQAYYDDGCVAGTGDAKASMSMAYERHDGYDSRFEPYFRQGYEACWLANS